MSGLTGQLGNLARTQGGIGQLSQQMFGQDISNLLGVGAQQQQLLQAGFEAQRQRDQLRDAVREINSIKSEMHEMKSLLLKLVGKQNG